MKKLIPLVLIAVALTGCGSEESQDETLTVLAASSLTGTFTQLAGEFETRNPGVQVKLVFDSSATLAQQAIEHAPGDVLATADTGTMFEAVDGDGVRSKPKKFATNVIVLAVPRGNPAHIGTVKDLNRDGVDFLTCVTTAPCGGAAAHLLEENGVTREPASEEVDVKAVLAKVEAGEADAALVYATDVAASAGKVTGIEVPGAANEPNPYWVAVTEGAKNGTLAAEWIDFLTGTEGRAVLETAGFGTVE